MRYEHIEMDLSTHALDIIRAQLQPRLGDPSVPMAVSDELKNLDNVIRARLQHTDQDPWAKQDNTDLIG